MAEIETKLADKIGNALTGGVSGIVGGLAGGLFNKLFGKSQADRDREQLEQQGRLGQQQLELNKQYSLFNYDQQMKYLRENAGAQMEGYEAAGLNPALMYGGGGGGGGTAPTGGNVSAPTAADSGSLAQQQLQTSMMLEQKRLMSAQADKTEAEAAKIAGVDTTNSKADAQLKQYQIDVNKAIGTAIPVIKANAEAEIAHSNETIAGVEAEKANLMWESFKANGFPSGNVTDGTGPVQLAMKAGWEQTLTELQKAKTDLSIQKAVQVVEEYKANLAKQGLPPDSPWYAKILGDLLTKAGLNPIGTAATIVKGM